MKFTFTCWIISLTALLGLLAASSQETNLRQNDFPKSADPMEKQATLDTEGKEKNCCLAGTYRSGYKTCKTCPKGKWSKDGETCCHSCPAGQYADRHLSCKDCLAGEYSEKRSDCCKKCGPGKVSDAKASSCTTCLAGYYADHIKNVCAPCAMNTYSAAAADICIPCAVGSYSGLSESQCHTCCAGQYYDPKLKECISCMAGYYTPNAGQECKKCPCMTYSAEKESMCHECPPGTKVNAGQTGCEKNEECPVGYTFENGKCVCKAGSSVTDGICVICEEDYYSEQDDAKECVVCQGLTSTDHTSCILPTDCYAGYTLSSDHLRCTCEAGSYIVQKDRRCKRCGLGKYSTKPNSAECLTCDGEVGGGGTTCKVVVP